METGNQHTHHSPEKSNQHYKHLLIMVVLSFIAMYVLMYSMVDRFANVYPNLNQFFMAGVMAAPMVLIEMVVMRSMYKNRKLNMLVIGLTLILFIGFYMGIRKQSGIGDRQFLKSMIPHHAGAILMSNEAEVKDPEIKELMKQILESQQREIDWMKKKLEELDK